MPNTTQTSNPTKSERQFHKRHVQRNFRNVQYSLTIIKFSIPQNMNFQQFLQADHSKQLFLDPLCHAGNTLSLQNFLHLGFLLDIRNF